MPTPPRKRPRPTPQPLRRSKVAGHGVLGIRPAAAPQQPAEQEGADEAAAVQPPVEQPPTAQAPAEQTLSDEDVAERPVVEDVAVGQSTAERSTSEESTAEQSTSEAPATAGEQTAVKPKPAPEPAPEPVVRWDEQPDRRDGLKLRLAGICAVLAVLCAALAVYFVVDTGNAAPPNVALTDTAGTKAVQQQVGRDLNAMMSYDYRDPAKTDRAAREALGNAALAGDYSDVINVLKQKGPSQQLSLQTRVVKSGVIELRRNGPDGDRAVVLALASQNYSKGGENGRSQATSARLRVNVKLDGERWRITNLEQY